MELSRQVMGFEEEKADDSPGFVRFSIKPTDDWCNLIFPGDVFDFYVDPTNGKTGMTWVMTGKVGSVRRSRRTTEKGAQTREIEILCWDFQKIINDVMIYFSQELLGRAQELGVSGDLTLINIGGIALESYGLTFSGSPAQIAESILYGLLGFGAQCVLPKHYPLRPDVVASRRAAARQRVIDGLSKETLTRLGTIVAGPRSAASDPGGVFGNLDAALQDRTPRTAAGFIEDDIVQALRDGALLDRLPGQTWVDVQKKLREASRLESELVVLKNLLDRETNALRGWFDNVSFDFVERQAVDGYGVDLSLLSMQGSIEQFLSAATNPELNQCLLDLRPVAIGDDPCFGDAGRGEPIQYSTEKDTLGINVTGTAEVPASMPGIQHVPAVVFREHPNATVEGFDAKTVQISNGKRLGFIPFGPVFSGERPGPDGGRIVYDYESVDLEALSPYVPLTGSPLKHLDVVRVYPDEVIEDTLARTDREIVNLLSVVPQGLLGETTRFALRYVFPIVSPVSISRHGLRVKQSQTRFHGVGRGDQSRDIDGGETERFLARMGLLQEHWFQHNSQFWSGELTMHYNPRVRPGMRLDLGDYSFYVKQRRSSWRFAQQEGRTHVLVTRGQPNNPFPVYVPPTFAGRLPSAYERQSPDGRLANYFSLPDERQRGHVVTESNERDLPEMFPRGGVVFPGDTTSTEGG